jgi:penicillin amidase
MVIDEVIRVRGGEDLVEQVLMTQHGPVINALAPDFCGEQPLALRWTTLEPERIMLAFYNMNRAADCLEFRDALRHFSSPSQNVVYADVDGNIGYTLAGRVPVRDKGEGQLPVPGWSGDYEWRGYIDFEELPHQYNPDQGYIVTANNRIVQEGYPHFLGHDFVLGDRAERIQELLRSRPKVDRAYLQQVQFDQVSPSARSIARLLAELQVDDVELQAMVDLMRSWDGHIAVDSPAAAVYEVFILRLIELLLSGKLGDLTERVIGKGPTPVLAELTVFSQHIWEWLHRILAQPQSHWFDLGGGEDRDEVLRIALKETLDDLNTKIGPMPQWAWGKLHRLTFDHPLSHIRSLENMLNRGPYPVGGDHNTVWQMGVAKAELQSESIIGPPYRFIADLGDLRNSVALLAPGESGQPDNRHYADQIEAWFQGGYHPMLFTRSDVEAYLEDKMRLLPADL